MRGRLPLALLLPLSFACVIKVGDSATDAGDTSGGASSQGSSGGDATAASDPQATSADTDPTTADPSDPTSASGPTSVTTTEPGTTTDDPTGGSTGEVDADEAATQLCVDTINMYRATIGLPALARWTDAEDCADAECLSDGMSGIAHEAFGMCGESAQNECPGWPGEPASMITGCLELMWNEGPGEDFNLHGHYINMSNPDYTRVACGFAPGMGGIWSVQNFQ